MYRLALIKCVGTVLRFAFVADTVAATKDTRSFFNVAMCSMIHDVIVLYCFENAAVHGALYFDFFQSFLKEVYGRLTLKLVPVILSIWADLTILKILIYARMAE